MAKQPVPFDILKTFPGLIHRQPLFVTDRFDASVDTSLDELVDKLPLSPELVQALTLHTGADGIVLRDVLNYERADWSALANSALPTEVLARTYLQAIHWSKESNAQMLS